MSGPQGVWTPQNAAELIRLWNTGTTSSVLAEKFGVSRGSIMGKVHRMKLEPHIQITRKKATRATRHLKPPPPKRMPNAAEIQEQKNGVKNSVVSNAVLMLTDTTCRWPIGALEDPAFRFCLEPRNAHTPYCAEHTALGLVKPLTVGRDEPKR